MAISPVLPLRLVLAISPLGRQMMLNHLTELIRLPDGKTLRIGGEEQGRQLHLHGADLLKEFRLEMGLPFWTYESGGFVMEKRIVLSRWQSVLDVSTMHLLTPVGLRSLSPKHPDYKSRYFGDLRSRDAAYHQGTVWGWLIGPFIDAYLATHPEDRPGARRFLSGFIDHLGEACIGSSSEVFHAEEPYTPRGCIAQAWSVAEVLRCLVKTSG